MIVQTAAHLFDEAGYGNTTMEDIYLRTGADNYTAYDLSGRPLPPELTLLSPSAARV